MSTRLQQYCPWEQETTFLEVLVGEVEKIKLIQLTYSNPTMILEKHSFLIDGEWSLKVKTPVSKNLQFTITQESDLMQRFARIFMK